MIAYNNVQVHGHHFFDGHVMLLSTNPESLSRTWLPYGPVDL